MAMISRTGRMIPFLDLGIGSPFYAHNRLWVRTAYDSATELHGSDVYGKSCCNFLIDGTVRDRRENKLCEEVEMVTVGPVRNLRRNLKKIHPVTTPGEVKRPCP